MRTVIYTVLFLVPACIAYGQSFTRKTYHDADKKYLKESYHVTDTIRNILQGEYVSYFMNGNMESRGQFTDNETTGVWEFFYETGKLKMRGMLKQNANHGLWEYFYESGRKSMQGNVNGRKREGEWISYYENGQVKEIGEYVNDKRHGLWKTFFEDGVLKGEIDYVHDTGRFTEYYHSGKVFAEGPRAGMHNVGRWRYFDENAVLESEGDFENGKKEGDWVYYHPNGTVSGKGKYQHDQRAGEWKYYYEDGKVSKTGSYDKGLKTGTWQSFYPDGSPSSETNFREGTGEYREYYPSGALKMKGTLVGDQRTGKWLFYYESGRKEGECDYKDNKGTYYGYFPSGTLQTKGAITGDLKTGTWEIYQEDGKLSGYYRPFYENKKLSEEIVALSGTASQQKKTKKRGKRMNHFDPRVNEFRGLIVGANPLLAFAGRLPLGVEFYLQERLGHEFEFIGIRNPFFKKDGTVPAGDIFERGYGICMKQKLYNPVTTGMWYFGHEIRFTNLGHFVNQPISHISSEIFTFGSVEQRIEYGLLLGYRISESNVREGFTIDAFVSGDIGYRGFDVDPKFSAYFAHINQSKFAASFHVGVNFGNVFSFR